MPDVKRHPVLVPVHDLRCPARTTGATAMAAGTSLRNRFGVARRECGCGFPAEAHAAADACPGMMSRLFAPRL